MFFGDFKNQCEALDAFGVNVGVLCGTTVLLGYYIDGDAYVLLKKNDTYYEVNGSHCGCCDLVGQWYIERTDLAAIEHRMKVLGPEHVETWRKLL